MNSALQVDRELPPALVVLGAGSEGTLRPREGPFPGVSAAERHPCPGASHWAARMGLKGLVDRHGAVSPGSASAYPVVMVRRDLTAIGARLSYVRSRLAIFLPMIAVCPYAPDWKYPKPVFRT